MQNIRQQALDNMYYRHVLHTGPQSQIVLMSIPAGSDIGEETHPDNDQILYLVEGRGTTVLGGEEQPFEPGDAVLVPAGTRHNFIASDSEDMKIITVYAPSHHQDGLIQKTKAEADAGNVLS